MAFLLGMGKMVVNEAIIWQPATVFIPEGLGYNNPSELALTEARWIWPVFSQCGLDSIGTDRAKAPGIRLSKPVEPDGEALQSISKDIKSSFPAGFKHSWRTAKDLPLGTKALVEMVKVLSQLATNS